MLRLAVLVSLLVCALGSAASAEERKAEGRGSAKQKPGKRKLSPYEIESLARGLDAVGGEIDPHPEGKRIESIEVVPLDVWEDRDPVPRIDPSLKGVAVAAGVVESSEPAPLFFHPILNWFHITTRPYIIDREVLQRPGDLYDKDLVEESERNLRALRVSVVLIRPIRGSRPGLVKLLVVTKDVWSLRLNTDPRFVNGKLDRLTLQPSEENLLGTNKVVNGLVQISKTNYSLGLGFIDPRVGGSRLRAAVHANLIFNCQTRDLEGAFGDFSYGKPLYSVHTKWAWNATVAWQNVLVHPGGTSGESICSGGQPALLDFASTEQFDGVPFEYRVNVLSGQFSVTRSFGVEVKNNISFGLEAVRSAFSASQISGLEPEVQRAFREQIPAGDTCQGQNTQAPCVSMRIGPFAQLSAYRDWYLRTIDLNTLGLQEDHLLGHVVSLRAYPAATSLGSTRNLIGLNSGLSYTFPIGDGLWRVFGEYGIELSTLEQTNANVQAGTRLATPRLGFGRFVYDAAVLHRYRNYGNFTSSLGGTNRLRGYRESAFFGSDLILSNLEYRSPAIQVLTVQLGAALFWDAGDAFRAVFQGARGEPGPALAPFRGIDQVELKHAVGGGLRFLFPQLDRIVFRIDVGVPLNEVPGAETSVVAQFGQAF